MGCRLADAPPTQPQPPARQRQAVLTHPVDIAAHSRAHLKKTAFTAAVRMDPFAGCARCPAVARPRRQRRGDDGAAGVHTAPGSSSISSENPANATEYIDVDQSSSTASPLPAGAVRWFDDKVQQPCVVPHPPVAGDRYAARRQGRYTRIWNRPFLICRGTGCATAYPVWSSSVRQAVPTSDHRATPTCWWSLGRRSRSTFSPWVACSASCPCRSDRALIRYRVPDSSR